MGARGPLPLPTAVKAARNTLRPCRVSSTEPHAKGLPKPSNDLAPIAKKEFKRLVRLLDQMGVIGAIDGNTLERYIRTWFQWRVAIEMVEKTGPVFTHKATDGTVKLRRNPYVDIVAALASQLDKLEQAFGLHPSARSRIEVPIAAAPAGNDKSRFFDTPMRLAQ